MNVKFFIQVVLVSCLFSFLKEKDSTLVDSIDGFNKAVSESRLGTVFTLAISDWNDVELMFEDEGILELAISLKTETARELILSGQSNLKFSELVFKNSYTLMNEVMPK